MIMKQMTIHCPITASEQEKNITYDITDWEKIASYTNNSGRSYKHCLKTASPHNFEFNTVDVDTTLKVLNNFQQTYSCESDRMSSNGVYGVNG